MIEVIFFDAPSMRNNRGIEIHIDGTLSWLSVINKTRRTVYKINTQSIETTVKEEGVMLSPFKQLKLRSI